MSDNPFESLDMDWDDFVETVQQTTKNLRKLETLTRHRWQIQGMEGFPEWYAEFEKAMQEAREGWMSSMC